MVDLSLLKTVLNGDAKKLSKFIQLYKSTFEDKLSEMEKNITHNEWETLRINAHSLKPQAEYIQIDNILNCLKTLESEHLSGDTDLLTNTLSNIRKSYESSISYLDTFIED